MASAHFGQAHLSSPQADTFQTLLAFVLLGLDQKETGGWSKRRLGHQAAPGARHGGGRSVAETDGMPRTGGCLGA